MYVWSSFGSSTKQYIHYTFGTILAGIIGDFLLFDSRTEMHHLILLCTLEMH